MPSAAPASVSAMSKWPASRASIAASIWRRAALSSVKNSLVPSGTFRVDSGSSMVSSEPKSFQIVVTKFRDVKHLPLRTARSNEILGLQLLHGKVVLGHDSRIRAAKLLSTRLNNAA